MGVARPTQAIKQKRLFSCARRITRKTSIAIVFIFMLMWMILSISYVHLNFWSFNSKELDFREPSSSSSSSSSSSLSSSFLNVSPRYSEKTKMQLRCIRNLLYPSFIQRWVWPVRLLTNEDRKRHPLLRSQRFPRVEERVQLYMGEWYYWSNNDTASAFLCRYGYRYNESYGEEVQVYPFRRSGSISSYSNNAASGLGTTLLLNREICEALIQSRTPSKMVFGIVFYTGTPPSEARYCKDSLRIDTIGRSSGLLDATGRAGGSSSKGASGFLPRPPILVHFGDELTQDEVPVFSKWRPARNIKDHADYANANASLHACPPTTARRHPHPIIWQLNTYRHYRPVYKVRYNDTPWYWKRNVAVFRGVLTGIVRPFRCEHSPRCRFVRENRNSTLVDAGLTSMVDVRDPNVEYLRKSVMPMKKLLEYKILISFEGNDVSSGLKWQLYSSSVVLMPTPTKTSWAMEELLEPWVHYIPLEEDYKDAEAKVRWVREHDEEARRIAQRATLFIEDLMFHPDASEDNQRVQHEIVQRYQNFWKMGDGPEEATQEK